MNKIRLSLLSLTLLLLGSTTLIAQTSKYRCLLQMQTYKGPKAYVAISLINPEGKYERTLKLLGPDKRWHDSLQEWHKAQQSSAQKVDGVTSASIAGGDRNVFVVDLDDKLFDKGYSVRFETSVEDQKYHVRDVEVKLNKASFTERVAGTGYIKLVKFTALK